MFFMFISLYILFAVFSTIKSHADMKCGRKDIRACSIFSDRGKIDGEFLFAINAKKLVARALIVGGNRAGSRINTLAGQI